MSGINLELVVPCDEGCTSVQQQFTVIPSIPNEENGYIWPNILGADDYKSYNPDVSNVVDEIMITFLSTDKEVEQQQYAELIVMISQAENDDNTGWSFYGNGVEVSSAQGNCQYNITSTLLSPVMLKVTISKVVSNPMSFDNTGDGSQAVHLNTGIEPLKIGFRYVMQHVTAGPDGEPVYNYYMSQDPRVGSRR